MKERPIIFSSEMVKAILDGKKTQTRRPIKPQPEAPLSRIENTDLWTYTCCQREWKYPYGQPGDRLWVKETWWTDSCDEDITQIYYKANCPKTENHLGRSLFKWKPSIFMPKWASRITLEIVDVRVERLQEITEEDAIKEGMKRWYPEKDEFEHLFTEKWYWEPIIKKRSRKCGVWDCPIKAFRELWNDIYTKKPEYQWQANPWVWVIEFKRC